MHVFFWSRSRDPPFLGEVTTTASIHPIISRTVPWHSQGQRRARRKVGISTKISSSSERIPRTDKIQSNLQPPLAAVGVLGQSVWALDPTEKEGKAQESISGKKGQLFRGVFGRFFSSRLDLVSFSSLNSPSLRLPSENLNVV